MERVNLMDELKKYFSTHYSGSAKNIYFSLNRVYGYTTICEALDLLEKSGYLFHKVTKATEHVKAHYVYYKVSTKKELLIKELLIRLVNILLQLT